MRAELLAGLSVMFITIGLRGLYEWTWRYHSLTNRPLIFWRLGRAGDFLHQVLQVIILFGGLSLIIWGLISAAWWSMLIAFALTWALIQLSRLSIYLDACLCSVFGPVLCAIGIVSLHFLTWIRMVIP